MQPPKESEQPSTQNPAAEKPKSFWKRFLNWSSDKWVGAVIGSTIVGLIFAWLNWTAPHLVYSIGDVRESLDNGKFEITVINDGSRYAEEIDCEIKASSFKIVSLSVEPTILKASTSVAEDGRKADVSFSRLNKGEKAMLTITATNPLSISKNVVFTVRGKDVKAISGKVETSILPSFWSLCLFVVIPFVGLGLLKAWAKNVDNRNEAKRHEATSKLFVFRNGPRRGTCAAGADARRLFDEFDKYRTQVTTDGVVYHVWSKDESGVVLKYEMVCEGRE